MLFNRRNFLQTSTSATTALLLASLDVFATPQKNNQMNTGFQLKVLATNWGYQGTIDAYCAKVKEEGYDGIEIWWPSTQKEIDDLFTTLKKYTLEVGFLTAGHQSNYAEHVASFKQMALPIPLDPPVTHANFIIFFLLSLIKPVIIMPASCRF